jgi:hypothetical protein
MELILGLLGLVGDQKAVNQLQGGGVVLPALRQSRSRSLAGRLQLLGPLLLVALQQPLARESLVGMAGGHRLHEGQRSDGRHDRRPFLFGSAFGQEGSDDTLIKPMHDHEAPGHAGRVWR